MRNNEVHAYEAPSLVELGSLAELTKGSAELIVDTDPLGTGSI